MFKYVKLNVNVCLLLTYTHTRTQMHRIDDHLLKMTFHKLIINM